MQCPHPLLSEAFGKGSGCARLGFLSVPLRNLAGPEIFLSFVSSNWASEASPTLGCSIEISRDMYMFRT